MRVWLLCGAVNAFIAVAAGAFAAHGLRQTLTPEMLDVFQVGARYQMYHSLALLAVGLMISVRTSAWADGAGYAFVLGILFFTGSLYALALTGVRVFGAITPFGGVAFLTGWVLLGIAAWRME
jgi:uncharacterized membrane protein YgdD (TMEM256/DUF423 family)